MSALHRSRLPVVTRCEYQRRTSARLSALRLPVPAPHKPAPVALIAGPVALKAAA